MPDARGFLAEAKARANRVTRKPWTIQGYNEYIPEIGLMSAEAADDGPTGPELEFIAHSISDVPRLVAALEAVLEVPLSCDWPEGYNGQTSEAIDAWDDAIRAVRQRIESALADGKDGDDE